MPFIPNTDAERQAMLNAIGAKNLESLFSDIPVELRAQAALSLPPALTELELMQKTSSHAARNGGADKQVCFLGAGCYDHFIPSIVRHLTARSEFFTAYTPYQAEASQGTLQVIYEFQSMIAELTGMEIANASLYDGASGLAEAVLMSTAITKRNRVILPSTIHPRYWEVVATYCQGLPIELIRTGYEDGRTSLEEVRASLSDQVAAVVVQQPNFLGCLEEMQSFADDAHSVGALLIAVVNPISLGIIQPPGEYGADLVVGEGQPLGIPMSLGGPGVGLFACQKQYARSAPGRMVGATTEEHGERRGFVLTLETREQHIRREKATSNICTNQGLCALAATAYLAALGPGGLSRVATLCAEKAHYAAARLAEVPGYRLAFTAPFFHEFAVGCPKPAAEVSRELSRAGIIGGYPLDDYPELGPAMLMCVTEKRTRAEIDRLVEVLRGC